MKNTQKILSRLLIAAFALITLCAPISGFAAIDGEMGFLNINDIHFRRAQGDFRESVNLSGRNAQVSWTVNDTEDFGLFGGSLSFKQESLLAGGLVCLKDEFFLAMPQLNKMLGMSASEFGTALDSITGKASSYSFVLGLKSAAPLIDKRIQKQLVQNFSEWPDSAVDESTVQATEDIEIMGESFKADKTVRKLDTQQFIAFTKKNFDALQGSTNLPSDTQRLIDSLQKACAYATFNQTYWIVDADTFKSKTTVYITLDGNSLVEDIQGDAGAFANFPMITLKIDIQSETHGALTNTAISVSVRDEETGMNMDVNSSKEFNEEKSSQQNTFNILISDFDKKGSTLKIDGKSADDRRDNSFDIEIKLLGSPKTYETSIAYEGDKSSGSLSDEPADSYHGSLELQMQTTDADDPQNIETIDLFCKTHLMAADTLPDDMLDFSIQLYEDMGFKLIHLSTLTDTERQSLIYETQGLLISSLTKLFGFSRVQSLVDHILLWAERAQALARSPFS